MAEYKKDGRHFSRRHVVNYKDGEEPEVERLKQEEGFPEPDFTRSPQDIGRALEAFRAQASRVLEDHGISGAQAPGYPRDSAPDIAARVLSGLQALEAAETHEELISAALWLGFDVAFAGAYQGESERMAGRGASSKGSGSEWAHLLAEHYLAKNSKLNGEAVYLRLKKDKGLKVGGWRISAGLDAKGRRAFKAKKPGDKDFRTVTVAHFYKAYMLEAKKQT